MPPRSLCSRIHAQGTPSPRAHAPTDSPSAARSLPPRPHWPCHRHRFESPLSPSPVSPRHCSPTPSPARKRRAACPHSRLKRGIAKRPIENMIVKTRRVDNHAAQPRIPLSTDSFGEVSLEAIYATAYAAGVLSGFPGSPAGRQSSARRTRGSGIRGHQPDERPAANAFRRTPSQRTAIPSTRTRIVKRISKTPVRHNRKAQF